MKQGDKIIHYELGECQVQSVSMDGGRTVIRVCSADVKRRAGKLTNVFDLVEPTETHPSHWPSVTVE